MRIIIMMFLAAREGIREGLVMESAGVVSGRLV